MDAASLLAGEISVITLISPAPGCLANKMDEMPQGIIDVLIATARAGNYQ